MTKREIGSRILKIREGLKLTQREMGKLVGLSHAAVSSYEKANHYPTIDTLFKIAALGNVPVVWLVLGENVTLEALEKLLPSDNIRLLRLYSQASDEDRKSLLRMAELMTGGVK